MMAAIIFASLLPGQEDTNQKNLDTIARLNKVEDSIQRFMAQQGRRPCPADGQYDVDNLNFGIEAANPGGCTGGTPAAPMGPDNGTGNIVAGTIPTKTLAIPDDYAFDAWGRRIEYVVDVRATANTSCYTLKTGGINIVTTNGGSVLDSVMYAYIVHGQSGYGAWPAQGSTRDNRLKFGNVDNDKSYNAGVSHDGNFTYSTTYFTNTIVSKDRTPTFDDVVYYLDKFKNTCCLGPKCNSNTGFQATGTTNSDTAGNIVLTLDLNGDGIADTAICAPNANGGVGAVYVIFGTKSGVYTSSLPLSPLGSKGVEIDGVKCTSLATGDVNGDGIQDLIIGASGYTGVNPKGAVYVIPGGTGTWPVSFNVANLVGTAGVRNGAGNTIGWRIDGESANELFGASVASRDFNGDDYDDILIGAPGYNNGATNDGAAYLLCGGSGALVSPVAISGVTGLPGTVPVSIPTCGMKITSIASATEKFGTAVAMGNIKGDSYADIIIGAPYGTGQTAASGKTYMIGGSGSAFPYPIATPLAAATVTGIPAAPAACTPGTCGTIFYGTSANDHSGSALDVGDINGDNVMDLIIGAPTANALGTRANAGATYVVYGTTTNLTAATINLSGLSYNSTPPTGFRVDGAAGDHSGTSVYGRCDVNGDGASDLLIGAPNAGPLGRANAGTVYAIFGGAISSSAIDASALAGLTGTTGVAVYGASAGDTAGTSVTGGDFYNYGLCDIVVGAPANNASKGAVYTVVGKHSWAATFDLSTLR